MMKVDIAYPVYMRYFGGSGMKLRIPVSVLLALLMLGIAALVQGEENKQLMMVFTTDTGGELNPCG